jgi:hypothetical protein
MDDIEIATTDEQILATYDVIRQLRPQIQAADYVRLVKVQQAEADYQLAALSQDELVTCVAGFRISHSLAWGRNLYVDDLVTDEQRRRTVREKPCSIGLLGTLVPMGALRCILTLVCSGMRLTASISGSEWISPLTIFA